jgi:BlaI family penicillinase repressor
MAGRFSLSNLSRRERQIMEIVYERGQVTAQDVWKALESPPSYSAVRATLSLLEKKGLLVHRRQGARYLFEPTVPAERAKVSALKRLVETFFNNSAEKVVATLIGQNGLKISPDELDRLERLIREAKKDRKK